MVNKKYNFKQKMKWKILILHYFVYCFFYYYYLNKGGIMETLDPYVTNKDIAGIEEAGEVNL